MNVESDGVARRDDGDGIVDDRRCRIGRGGDGPDDPVWGELRDHHPRVSGHNLRLQVLGPRGLGRHQAVLDRLVLPAPQTGLLGRHVPEALAFTQHGGAHGLDDGLPRSEPHLAIVDERRSGGGHCGIDVGVDPVTELDIRHGELVSSAQRRRRPPRNLGGGHPAPDPLDDRLYLCVAQHRYRVRPSSRPLWYRSSPPTSHESTIAMTTASTGRSRVSSV